MRAVAAAGGDATVVLASDRAVQRLNARHRGRNKPTNVLTFDAAASGLPGEIVLASGTVRREAAAADRPPCTTILAHLVVHGALHLQGYDHNHAGAARRMEMAEARILGRLGLPNRWKRARAATRAGLLERLTGRLWRRTSEHSVRDSIAELVQEAAQETPAPGEAPELDRHERALIANVLRLRGTTADDVMARARRHRRCSPHSPWTCDAGLDEAVSLFRREGHSRLPVFREQLDDIVGMVHLKDVFANLGNPASFKLEAILRRPLLVAPQTPALDLLLQMRQARVHMALVVDEYGGIDGLVTIEDLVEIIVGDISDEHDEVAGPLVTERADGTLDMDARLPIEEFEIRLGPVLSEGERDADIDTVGGLVLTLAGHVPARGEVIGHPSGMEFRVLEADPRRIRRLRVRRAPTEQEAAADNLPVRWF